MRVWTSVGEDNQGRSHYTEGSAKLENISLRTHVRRTWVRFRPTCRKNLT
jgi:hypothetical protein